MTDRDRELFQVGFDVILAEAPPPVVDPLVVERARSGRSGWHGAAVSALWTFILVGAVGLLLSSQGPEIPGDSPTATTSSPFSTPTTGPAGAPDEQLAADSGLVEVYREEGWLGFHTFVQSGDLMVVAGWRTVVVSEDGLGWRRTGGRPDGEEGLMAVALQGDRLIGIGATDGNHTAVYRSDDLAATWEPIELPVPDGTGESVAHVAHAGEGGFLVAGATTTSDFDSQVTVVVWESVDGDTWTITEMADLGSDFGFVEQVLEENGRLFAVLRTFGGRMLVGEREDRRGGWSLTDITDTVRSLPAITPEFVNFLLLDAVVDDGLVTTWWSLNNGIAGGDDEKFAAVVAEQQTDGTWAVTVIEGPAPIAVARLAGRFFGVAQTTTPYTTSTEAGRLITSADGQTWTTVSEYPGVKLTGIISVDDSTVLVYGNEISVHPDGYGVVDAGAIWIETIDGIGSSSDPYADLSRFDAATIVRSVTVGAKTVQLVTYGDCVDVVVRRDDAFLGSAGGCGHVAGPLVAGVGLAGGVRFIYGLTDSTIAQVVASSGHTDSTEDGLFLILVDENELPDTIRLEGLDSEGSVVATTAVATGD